MWGAAWVGAWFLTTRLLTAFSVPLAVGVEIGGAIAAGGLGTALLLSRSTAAPVGAPALRWATAGVLGLAAAWAVALVVHAVVPGGAPVDRLDIGTTVALPLAVWFAVRPAVRIAATAAATGATGATGAAR